MQTSQTFESFKKLKFLLRCWIEGWRILNQIMFLNSILLPNLYILTNALQMIGKKQNFENKNPKTRELLIKFCSWR